MLESTNQSLALSLHHAVCVYVCMCVQYLVTSFLGSYIPPGQLSLAALKAPAGPQTFEAAISGAQLLAPGIEGGGMVRRWPLTAAPSSLLVVGSRDCSGKEASARGASHNQCVAHSDIEFQAGSGSK
jgi:hypothetical protein